MSKITQVLMSSISKTKFSRVYGWKRDKPDSRDFKFKVVHNPKILTYPSLFDLRTQCQVPEVYDQGQLGSCTANGIVFCYHFDEYKQNNKVKFMGSRLFLYYNERDMEGTTGQDSGASIRDGVKSINSIGLCSEDEWPYDISEFTSKPPQKCYDMAENCKSLLYSSVGQTINDVKQAVCNGYPIVFGFDVYSSFETDTVESSGIAPMPDISKEQLLGGHCVVIVGYDDSITIPNTKNLGAFICRNSWGTSWGKNGYFYLSYDYINSSLSSDYWIITSISDPENIPQSTINNWSDYVKCSLL